MKPSLGFLLFGILLFSQCQTSPPLNKAEILDSLEQTYSLDWETIGGDSPLVQKGKDYLIDLDIDGVIPELEADYRNYMRRITLGKRFQKTRLGRQEYYLLSFERTDDTDVLYVVVWDVQNQSFVGYFEQKLA